MRRTFKGIKTSRMAATLDSKVKEAVDEVRRDGKRAICCFIHN